MVDLYTAHLAPCRIRFIHLPPTSREVLVEKYSLTMHQGFLHCPEIFVFYLSILAVNWLRFPVVTCYQSYTRICTRPSFTFCPAERCSSKRFNVVMKDNHSSCRPFESRRLGFGRFDALICQMHKIISETRR